MSEQSNQSSADSVGPSTSSDYQSAAIDALAEVESSSQSEQDGNESESEAEAFQDSNDEETDQETEVDGEGEESQDENSEEAGKDDGQKGPKIKDDDLIELSDGQKVPFAEMKSGYLRHADYTQKTQALAKDRVDFEAELAGAKSEMDATIKDLESRYKEVEDIIILNQQRDLLFQRVEKNNPELYQLLTGEFSAIEKEFSNPVIQKLQREIQELKGMTKKSIESVEKEKSYGKINEVKAAYENEISEMKKDFIPSYEKMGIKPRWDDMRKVWIAGESQNITMKQAFFAVHGDEIHKLNASKTKVNNVINKPKSPTLGSKGSSGAGGAKNKIDFSKLSYEEAALVALGE